MLYSFCNRTSSPSKVRLAYVGLTSPPCGLPSSVGNSFLLSMYPHLRNCFIILLSAVILFNIHSWLMLSKHPLISPSRIHWGDVFRERSLKIYSIASCALLPLRNPNEFLSAVASSTGSNARSCNPCIALSCIVGIPRGRFSFLPYFSI